MGGKGSGGRRNTPPPARESVKESTPAKVQPDINHRSINAGLELMDLEDIDDWSDAEVLKERFLECLDICDKWELKPIVSNIALGFGISAALFQDIVFGRMPRYKGLSRESMQFLQKVYDFLKQNLENNLMDERGNPVKWIFLGKNYFGLTDQRENIVRHVDDKPELPQGSSVANKYAELVGVTKSELPEAKVVSVEDVPEVVIEDDENVQNKG